MLPITIGNTQEALSMTSREIAELAEKDHKNVIRDIRIMLVGLYGTEHVEKTIPEHYRNRFNEYVRENAESILNAIVGDGSELSHQNSRGFSWKRDSRGYVTEFQLDKTHSMTLVSGYNVQLRKRIIDRWIELEQALVPQFAIPKTLAGALRLAADQADTIAQQQATLAYQAPKVEALARISQADGSMCIRDAAKVLQMRPIDLTAWLSQNGWIYHRPGRKEWLAYQDKIQAGLMEHKCTTVDRPDGTEKMVDQARLTSKGVARIAELMVAVIPQ